MTECKMVAKPFHRAIVLRLCHFLFLCAIISASQAASNRRVSARPEAKTSTATSPGHRSELKGRLKWTSHIIQATLNLNPSVMSKHLEVAGSHRVGTQVNLSQGNEKPARRRQLLAQGKSAAVTAKVTPKAPAKQSTPVVKPKASPKPSSQPSSQYPVQATFGSSPSVIPAKTPAKSPAKTPVTSPAKTPAKSPAKTPAKSPAKTPAKSPAKTPAKSPATKPSSQYPVQATFGSSPSVNPPKTPAKSPAKTPVKVPAKTPVKAPSKASVKGSPVQSAASKLAVGQKRLDAFVAFMRNRGGYENYLTAMYRTGFAKNLAKIMASYSVTLFVPRDREASGSYGSYSEDNLGTAFSLMTVFGLWTFDQLNKAFPGSKLLSTAFFPSPAKRPYVNIYKVVYNKHVSFSGKKNDTWGTQIVTPDMYVSSTVRAHGMSAVLPIKRLTDVVTPYPSPPPKPKVSPPAVPAPKPPPPAQVVPPYVPAGLKRYLKFKSFLEEHGGFEDYLAQLEDTGYNEMLVKLMTFYPVTLLVPKTMVPPEGGDPPVQYKVQRLGMHTLLGMFDAKTLQFARPGVSFITGDYFPPNLRPLVSAYRLPNANKIVLNGTSNAASGSVVVEKDMYWQPDFVTAHAIDKLMTPYRYWSSSLVVTPLQPGQDTFAALMGFLGSKAKYQGFQDLLTNTGYNNTLADLMSFTPVTIFLPLNVTITDGQTRYKFLQQRLGLHVVPGYWDYVGLQTLAPGNALNTADLYPPFPKPGVPIFRTKNNVLAFSGSRKDTVGSELITPDAYIDQGHVRVHIIDLIMTPSHYQVI